MQKKTVQLPKGLTKTEAWKLARRKSTRDFRGIKYNSRTGKAVLI